MSAELNRLLDNGVAVVLFKNRMGSYTGIACEPPEWNESLDCWDWGDTQCEEDRITEHFTPEETVSALADKVSQAGKYKAD